MTDDPVAAFAADDVARVARRPADTEESSRASRVWWERASDDYQAEHGDFLGDAFVWCPEGLTEEDARLLGDPATLTRSRVLEVGCGAAWCARWLRLAGVTRVVGIDLAFRQLQHSRRIDEHEDVRVPVAQADALRLPFADASFDVVCSAFGGLPFVPEADAAVAESARVLGPGGRLVFAVPHPVRWCFPDDPTERGLTVKHSYFDRRAYVEENEQGRAVYVEHHHTVGDWIRAVAAAGLRLLDMVEPEWPTGHDRVWGGWGPVRGRLVPGTAIFVCEKEASGA